MNKLIKAKKKLGLAGQNYEYSERTLGEHLSLCSPFLRLQRTNLYCLSEGKRSGQAMVPVSAEAGVCPWGHGSLWELAGCPSSEEPNSNVAV